MSRCLLFRTRALILGLATAGIMLAAAAPGGAAVKAMNLEEAVATFDGVISGVIEKKEVVQVDIGGETATFTRLTIRGIEMTTGAAATRDIFYRGGMIAGRLDSPSTAPREHQTRAGAAVVVFWWKDEQLGLLRTSSFASVFQVQAGADPDDPTVIGLDENAPIDRNIKLSEFSGQVRAIAAELRAKGLKR